MDELYWHIKVKAHFQDTCKQADLSDAEYRFKSKSKNWVPTKIHHAIDTFLDTTKKALTNI